VELVLDQILTEFISIRFNKLGASEFGQGFALSSPGQCKEFEMFDEMVVSGKNKTATNKSWSVAASAMIQVLVIGGLVLLPLIYTEALPKGMLTTFLVAPPPPPPPPPPAAVVKQVRLQKVMITNKMVAPTVVPKKVEVVKDEPPAMNADNDIGVAGGTGGVLGGVLGGAAGPPPPPKPAAPQRIRVGGNVEAAHLVNKVEPQYPPIAQAAHVSGTVVLRAVISKGGSIEQLQFVSGPPLLMKAAMDAVKQWRYQPTVLNGEPVEVDTTIDVVFSLGQAGQ
jgi:periplasmic protein TonB